MARQRANHGVNSSEETIYGLEEGLDLNGRRQASRGWSRAGAPVAGEVGLVQGIIHMHKTIVRWQDWSGAGLEHLVLTEKPTGVVAEAALLAGAGANAYAACYRIRCDRSWRTRSVAIQLIGEDRKVEMTSDGAGNWTDRANKPLPRLQGAIDVDLSASPFTNTLPIRRLGLQKGEAPEILAVYILFPDLTMTTDPQRYTCLDPGKRCRYESLDSNFVREIEVDDKALVVTYPGLFKRIQ